MSRQMQILGLVAAAIVAARALVLAIDAAVVGWRRRKLYQG